MKSAEVPTVPSFYKLLFLSNSVKLPLNNHKEKCRSADSAGFWQTFFLSKILKPSLNNLGFWGLRCQGCQAAWLLGCKAAWLHGCSAAGLQGRRVASSVPVRAYRRVRAFPTGPGIPTGPVIPCLLLSVQRREPSGIEHGLPLLQHIEPSGLRAFGQRRGAFGH